MARYVWNRDDERDAIAASPTDPSVEYVRPLETRRVACLCPRTVVLDEQRRSWLLKVAHRLDCDRSAQRETETDRRPVASRALTAITEHRCACAGCPGQLVVSEWPSWRRCAECRCMWRADTLDGRTHACTVAHSRCPARSGAGSAGRPAGARRAA